MTYAAIAGWGKCTPPAVLTNADLATLFETSDEWITTRTGIQERRVSHVPGIELALVAAKRALACAGARASDVELVVYGSCSNDEQVPNTASALQFALQAGNAATMDINSACTSFLYGLSSATAMIRTGVVKSALVVGVEVITPFMDWRNRNAAVLFGDGAAAVLLLADEAPRGVLGECLGCYADARATLRVRGTGLAYCNRGVHFGDTLWDFDGQEIFKRAVLGMSHAATEAMAKCGVAIKDVDLVIPHQANVRIINAVAHKLGVPKEKLFINVQRYGNMSAATVPVALVDALLEGRVDPGALLMTPAFGGGLTWCAHLIRWGERILPHDVSDAMLPACDKTALEIVGGYLKMREPYGRSTEGLMAPEFVETKQVQPTQTTAQASGVERVA